MALSRTGTPGAVGARLRHLFDEAFALFVGGRGGIFGEFGEFEKAMREKRDFQFFHSGFPQRPNGFVHAVGRDFEVGNRKLLRENRPSIQHDGLEGDRNRTEFRGEVADVFRDSLLIEPGDDVVHVEIPSRSGTYGERTFQ